MDNQKIFIIREIIKDKTELGPGFIIFQYPDKFSAERKLNELQISKIRESLIYSIIQFLSDERMLMINEYFLEQFGKPLLKEHPDGDIEYLFNTLEDKFPPSATDKQLQELIRVGKLRTHILFEFEGAIPLYTVEKNPALTLYNSGKIFRLPEVPVKWYYHSEKDARQNTLKLIKHAIDNYLLKRIEVSPTETTQWDELASLKKEGIIDTEEENGIVFINEKLSIEDTEKLFFTLSKKPFLIREATIEEMNAEKNKYLNN